MIRPTRTTKAPKIMFTSKRVGRIISYSPPDFMITDAAPETWEGH